jgi:hypothetical protein
VAIKWRLDAKLTGPIVRSKPRHASSRYSMQESFLQAQAQPLVKLAQANMDLMTRFWSSREVTSQTTAKGTEPFQQATDSAMHFTQTRAFADLCQGMLNNYTAFLTEWSQRALTLASQAQAAWVLQAHEVSNDVIESTGAQARRARRAH